MKKSKTKEKQHSCEVITLKEKNWIPDGSGIQITFCPHCGTKLQGE